MHRYKDKCVHEGFEVIDCIDCGYRHQYPLPSQDELEDFYKSHFEESTPSPNFQDKKDTIECYVETDAGKRVLDVGAWDGDFLGLFNPSEWDRVGIEPNRKKKEILEAKNIDVYHELIDEIDPASLGVFDAVNLSFVLEHVLYPEAILRSIFDKLLKPGGVLCVEVPNDFNPFQMCAVETLELPPYWITHRCLHVNYFDGASLEKLLTGVGYEVLLREADFPMEFFLLSGDNYLGNNEAGKKAHGKRCEFEDNLRRSGRNDLKRRVYQALASLNIGRSIMVFGRKPDPGR